MKSQGGKTKKTKKMRLSQEPPFGVSRKQRSFFQKVLTFFAKKAIIKNV